MAAPPISFDVLTELAKLKHEKRNQNLHRLPPNATIQRRPIIHAPIASPFAGRGVQKVVYISSKTPFMSAVKRAKRLLHEIEKRAMQDVKLIGRGERAGMQRLAESRERLAKEGEEVLVKASGRAMAKALRVGEWFRTKETEMECKVEVRTGSVSVVDDVVELEEEEEESEGGVAVEHEVEETVLEGGDTTLELLGDVTTSTNEHASSSERNKESGQEKLSVDRQKENIASHDHPSSEQNKESTEPATGSASGKKRKRKRKGKERPVYDPDDLPEQRLRWIKTVEVAISFNS